MDGAFAPFKRKGFKEWFRHLKCKWFHRKEIFEYLNTLHSPIAMKVKMYGCKKCDLWIDLSFKEIPYKIEKNRWWMR